MSRLSFNASTGTPEISSSGRLPIDYEELFALFHDARSKEDSDFWLPSVEDDLRKPRLGGDTFELLLVDEPEAMLNATTFQSLDSERKWETIARFLFLYLRHANNCWLRPSSTSGKPSLVEHHSGTVGRIVGDYVSVCFGAGENQFEAEYELGHFLDPQSVARGDRIEAVIGLWHQKHQARGIDRFLTGEEQKQIDADWESDANTVRGDLEL